MPSAVIRHFHHDAATSRLLIVFQTGRRYVYEGVPQGVAEQLRRSRSKGEFFNANIRDNYRCQRVED
jgi:hypothetical protein